MKSWVSSLVFLATVLSSPAWAGDFDDDCSSATPIVPGTYAGLQTYGWAQFGFSYVDPDWSRFVVPPGRTYDVFFQTTNVVQGGVNPGYYVSMSVRETSPTLCAGVIVTWTSTTNHVTVTNTTPVPKAYVLAVFADVTGTQQTVTVDYDLVVQDSLALVGVPYCPGAPNSVGGGGTLAVSGSNSVAANNLVFAGAQLPPNGVALLASGTTNPSHPFGDGTLCIGGSVARLAVAPVSALGTCNVALDLQNLPSGVAIAPGNLRYFQLYYRDAFGPLGTGFNMTNGMAVVFTP